MTPTSALQEAWTLFAGDTDYPSTGTDEWLTMVTYGNSAINTWQNYIEGDYWRELFGTQTTTLTASSSFTGPTNFKFPASDFVIIDSAGSKVIFEYVQPYEAQRLIKADPAVRIYWITGSGTTYTVNISQMPSTQNGYLGATASFDYYKDATTFTTGEETTHIEMADPYFYVEWVAKMLFLADKDASGATPHSDLANAKLTAMRRANALVPFLQSNRLADTSGLRFGR